MYTEKIQLTDDKNITLSVYLPDISDEMPNMKIKPAVLVIPGGAYMFCSDREAEPVAFEFMAKGYNVFVLRYSLKDKAAFPRPLLDAEKAMDVIKENAVKWHTDAEKIAVCGFSAGGHLAAALSSMSSKKPAACILGYPCILDSTSPILAKPVESLDKYVTKETPPTFIAAASDDGCVPIINSLKYAEALTENQVPYEMHIFNKGGHGFSTGTDVVCATDELRANCLRASSWVELCVEWLKTVFNN